MVPWPAITSGWSNGGMNTICETFSHMWDIKFVNITCSYVWYVSVSTPCVRHDSFICETLWDMTHSYVWYDLVLKPSVRHDSFMCETWPGRLWDRTTPYNRNQRFVCVTWLVINTICKTWLIRTWDMTNTCVGHDSIICVTLIKYAHHL